jgi:hypothetical protein
MTQQGASEALCSTQLRASVSGLLWGRDAGISLLKFSRHAPGILVPSCSFANTRHGRGYPRV